MKNYHKTIGFPKSLVIPEAETLQLVYTKHARERQKESYKLLVVPEVVVLKPSNVYEVCTEDDINISRALLRIPYSKTQDMILVIQPIFAKRKAKVVTL